VPSTFMSIARLAENS